MMKKIWKVIFVLAGVICAVGIICTVAGFAMGGSVDKLLLNERAQFVISWLSPAKQISNILAFFGA